jgi:hypothetical protein
MIVSHQNRFIFLKTKKTASTSIELALSALCGPKDIITPLAFAEDEVHRQGATPQNWIRCSKRADLARLIGTKLLRRPNHVDYYAHMHAECAKSYLGPKIWNSYFKFVVERNPWDRQVSLWQFKMGKAGNRCVPFRQFLDSSQAVIPNSSIYMIGANLAVDYVVRYEHLQEDLDTVLDHLGTKSSLELPRAKSRFRQVGDYREQYDDYAQEWVARRYKTEISLFGYTFSCASPTLLSGKIPQDQTSRCQLQPRRRVAQS